MVGLVCLPLVLQEPIHCPEHEGHRRERGNRGSGRHARVENDELAAHCQQGDQYHRPYLDDAVAPQCCFDDGMFEFHRDEHGEDRSEERLKYFVIEGIERSSEDQGQNALVELHQGNENENCDDEAECKRHHLLEALIERHQSPARP